MHDADIIIIGAGIMGLATAFEITNRYPYLKILIFEKENNIALHQTGRNSGVIHSGIYYRPGSLKAKTCKEGLQKMYSFCQEHNVPHQRTGKVIIACDKIEETYLQKLYERGLENEIPGIELVDEKLKEIEPFVEAKKGIWVPSTGIVNYTKVCQKLLEILMERKVKIVLAKEIKKIFVANNLVNIITNTRESFSSQFLFNCAGLHADHITKISGAKPKIRLVPFRGEYYKLVDGKENLVKGLIYPVPNPLFPFLGVHFTKMVDGSVEIGPNAVLSLKKEGYSKTSFSLIDSLHTFTHPGFWKFSLKNWKTGLAEYKRSLFKKAFVKSAQRLLPSVNSQDMEFQKIGVRAQALDKDGNLVDDFCIQEAPKIIHVLNAPSPAATACFAIARSIVDMASSKFHFASDNT